MTWTADEFEAKMRSDLGRWQGRQGIEEIKIKPDDPEQGRVRRWRIYTNTKSYSLSVREPYAGSSYLGCIADARTPRAGETWTRGNDLHDGPLSPETWHRILADIVAYEMVEVHDPAQAFADAEILPPPMHETAH